MVPATEIRKTPNCPVCGFPLDASGRCTACGNPAGRVPAPAASTPAAAASEEQNDTPPELFDALNSFKTRNYAYYLPACLNKICDVAMPTDHPDGKFWNLGINRPAHRGVYLCVGLDPSKQILQIEAPLVHLDPAAGAPVLRAALELNGKLARSARVALRPPTLVLRQASPLSKLPPMSLIGLIDFCADLSKDLELYFVTRFGCRSAAPPPNAVGVGSGYALPPRRMPLKVSLEAGA